VSGKKNADRSLKRMARKHVRDAQRAMRNLRCNKQAGRVRHDVVSIEVKLATLLSLIKEECLHCGEKTEFGYNVCTTCADERGP
jgi:hypothetical protein